LASIYRPKHNLIQFALMLVLGGPFLGCTVTDEADEQFGKEEVIRTPAPVIAPPPGSPRGSELAGSTRAQELLSGSSDEVDFIDSSPEEFRKNRRSRENEDRARSTDAEVSESEGGLGSAYETELGAIERDLGLEPSQAPIGKAPSLSLGVARVKALYKQRRFEEGLIETNRLLEFYPRSPQLLMMKGTLHQWLGQLDLALASYREAAARRPSPKLGAQIRYLELKIRERERLKGWVEGDVIPGGAESVETGQQGAGIRIPAPAPQEPLE
jgi:hypothetical protein